MTIDALAAKLTQSGLVYLENLTGLVTSTEVSKREFMGYWGNLVLDQNFSTYTHRERRIIRYRMSGSNTNNLLLSRNTDFLSNALYEAPYAHGINKLTSAENGFIESPLLRSLVEFDLSVIAAASSTSTRFDIDVHQFRVCSQRGVPSPTTSGIHQDGYDFVCMHLVNKHNTVPVFSEVFSSGREVDLILRKELTIFLETLIVDDKNCWHRASPVVQEDLGQPAWRDLLILSFRRQRQESADDGH